MTPADAPADDLALELDRRARQEALDVGHSMLLQAPAVATVAPTTASNAGIENFMRPSVETPDDYWGIPASGAGGLGVKPTGTTQEDRSKRMNSMASRPARVIIRLIERPSSSSR